MLAKATHIGCICETSDAKGGGADNYYRESAVSIACLGES
ncbi:hypothetical protein BN2475_220043 [Paraburkholderia ribeironis]|uniref:Uncharacterized protein n=1 Tax=Paraburkholderia ribeironis TaxID=1247936 RepID=A0A1N7RX64_9BURK|nr:hypothetical protein BN2475_220043 [Paraburkholderia ribeironis]